LSTDYSFKPNTHAIFPFNYSRLLTISCSKPKLPVHSDMPKLPLHSHGTEFPPDELHHEWRSELCRCHSSKYFRSILVYFATFKCHLLQTLHVLLSILKFKKKQCLFCLRNFIYYKFVYGHLYMATLKCKGVGTRYFTVTIRGRYLQHVRQWYNPYLS